MSVPRLLSGMERFGRLYVASTQVSHAVARSRSREELLREVVRVLVEAGEFAMALVSWHDPATHELQPVACFGDEAGYASRIRMFTDERSEGQGPAETAFKAGVPYICNDFQNDPVTARWRDAARASGWQASAAIPIVIDGAPRGLLSVCAFEIGVFGSDQVELLQQVALDLAFGLEYLDSQSRLRDAEAARSTSEQRLKSALDAAELGTFDWDLLTGNFVLNRHGERIFGFEPDGFAKTFAAFQQCVHPADLPGLQSALDVALTSHSTYSDEFRIVWPDGSEHWIAARGAFHYDDSLHPARMYGAAWDITERKREQAALRESEARLQQALRVANIGIFDHDHVTATLYWSAQYRAIFGWTEHQPESFQLFLERVHPDDRERIAAAIERSHDPAGDGSFDVEYRLLFPDGSIRYLSARGKTFFTGEGSARRSVRSVGAVRDVTEQAQAEEEQKKLATVVEMSRDFIGVATLEGRVVYLNQAAMNMVGLSTIAEVRQKTIFDFFSDSALEQGRDEMYKALLDSGYWSAVSQLRHFQTGKPIDVDLTAFQIRDDNGAPIYIATVTRDITERKQAEAEMAKLEDQLFQAQKMESIGRLAGGLAHDFNNLLTVINGYSQLALTRLNEGDPLRASLSQIRKAGASAETLTRQLLAFSRKQVLQPRVLDLNQVVREMQPMLERLVGELVGVRVALNSASAVVYADPIQVEQVILNLAANARDAMPRGGTLLIETADFALEIASSERWVRLTVSDSGAGMDEETQQRVFEPFFTTKPVGEGTGLGLSTVQGIVAQSGGHIDIRSEPGRGTTFEIYLPWHDGAVAGLEKPVGLPLRGSETVLVVEDRAEVRGYTVAALQAYGYRVIHAENANDALLICEREHEHIDLVLTDVMMPFVGGPELASRLRKLYSSIKILFMSAYAENVHGASDESAHFIQKPFNPEQLARTVREVLDAPTKTARILVADDEPGVRAFLRETLEQAGYEVMEAADGKLALKSVRAGGVGLVITDLVMPEREGLETIGALRKESPSVPLIAISGACEGRYLKVAKMLGAKAVLNKPFTAELLLTTVAAALKPPSKAH